MNQKIIYQKRIGAKIVIFMAVAAMLGTGLFYYIRLQRVIKNFHFAYLTDLYIPLYAKEVSEGVAHLYTAAASTLGSEKPLIGNPQAPADEARSVPVLIYHGLLSKETETDTAVGKFRRHMLALKEAGYNTVSIYDFVDYIKGGKKLPAKSFLLTFDDGRKDSYYPVDPVLKAIGFRAVMYVITKHSLYEGKRYYYLDREELEVMRDSGRWDLQPHAYDSHGTIPITADGAQDSFFGNKMWLAEENRLERDDEYRARIRSDMLHARNDIEDILGVGVVSFAFPFNNFAQNQTNFPGGEQLLMEESSRMFRIAFAQASRADLKQNSPGVSDFLMRRIEVQPQWEADELLSILEATGEKTPFYADRFDTNNGWEAYWGQAEVNNHALDVFPQTGGVSGAAILEGTATWSNYRAVSSVQLVHGSTMSIMARYRDRNYIACTYSIDGRVRLEEAIDGRTILLGSREPRQRFPAGAEMHIGIYADGPRAGCLLDNEIVVSGVIETTRLSSGGIGFKTWDQQPDVSLMRIFDIKVEEISHSAQR